jgi:hypothetical protein
VPGRALGIFSPLAPDGFCLREPSASIQRPMVNTTGAVTRRWRPFAPSFCVEACHPPPRNGVVVAARGMLLAGKTRRSICGVSNIPKRRPLRSADSPFGRQWRMAKRHVTMHG